MSNRQNGEIVVWVPEKNYGFIRTEHGKKLFFSTHCVQEDWKGSKSWAFQCSMPVTFLIKQRMFKGHLTDCADDIAPLFPLSEPEDLNSYRETSEVINTIYDYGFLRRPCGDTLFFHLGEVVQGYEKRWDLLEAGSPVFHGLRCNPDTGKWRAAYVELYSYEELNSFKSEPESEPELVEVASTATNSVLAPDTRSLPLIEIIRRRKL
jgi:hypothetical protein